MSKRKRKPRELPALSEQDWATVFNLRCRSKRGEYLSPDAQALCRAAYDADPKRYKAMNDDVFVATAPFGTVLEQRTSSPASPETSTPMATEDQGLRDSKVDQESQ